MPRLKTRQKTTLQQVPVLGAGFSGLNTELQTLEGLQNPTWATVLENAVWDNQGRVSLRKGYTVQTTTPATGAPTFHVIHEFLQADGSVEIIAMGSDFKIWMSADEGATWTDISGSLSTARTDWTFVNYYGECYATGPGSKIWQYTGVGTFTEIATSPVTRGILLSAFGRLWAAVDADSTIFYSALLDGTDWTGTSTGSIDTSNVWTQGYDIIQGIHAFGSTFVVFGREHILMYVDGSGSVVGIDPDNMYVVDTVEGTGLRERDSVVNIGEGDLWFISPEGVQSLARVIQDKTNPLVSVSSNVRSKVRDLLANQSGEANSVQAIYSPEEHMVLFNFTGDNEMLMFDTQMQDQDGAYRSAVWTGTGDRFSLLYRRDGTLWYGLNTGEVAKYQNYRDDTTGADTVYDLVFATPWLDAGAHNNIKMVKGFYGHFYGRETLTATARWAFDYRPLEFSEAFTNDYLSSGAEFGVGEFGEDEFGTGHRFRRQYVGGMGEGQFFKLWITVQSTDVDAVVAIQEVGASVKFGRQV